MRRYSFGTDMKTGLPMTEEQTKAVKKRHEYISRRGYNRAVAQRGREEAGRIFGGHWVKENGRFQFKQQQEGKQ